MSLFLHGFGFELGPMEMTMAEPSDHYFSARLWPLVVWIGQGKAAVAGVGGVSLASGWGSS